MKTKTSNSLNSLNGFSGTFSIHALVKNVGKTIRTIQNPSLSPKNKDLETEELKSNPSEPFRMCSGCKNNESIAGIGAGCIQVTNVDYSHDWSLL